MAELLGRWQTAVDSNLNAYPGAKLLTFDSVAKTTPKTTYSDPELSTPHTNPVVANGSGQFPQIFAPAGDKFYLVLNTAANVLVDDFDDVNALGDDGGNQFNRDFGLGGRIEFSGVDGVVDIAMGPPEGDDVGGEGRIGGWDGTQGEALELDFAEIAITGNVAVQGLTIGGLANAVPVIVARGTLAGAASVDLALPAEYGSFELHVRNFITVATTAVSLHARLSFDDALTFKSAAADYANQGIFQNNGTAGAVAVFTHTDMLLTNNVNSFATSSGGSDIIVDLLTGAGRETRTISRAAAFVAGNGLLSTVNLAAASTNNKSYGRATNIRLFAVTVPGAVATNMSCEYLLIGKP